MEVAVTPTASTVDRIEQSVYSIERARKADLLAHLLRTTGAARTVVFTKTKHGADKLVRKLRAAGVASDAIHGNKAQGQRTRALDGFRSGRTPVLVATDIAARGLDVDGILEVAGINGEEGRRLERVAKARPSLTNPEPGQLKQLALWAGILPDPIEQTTSPRPEAHWLAYLIKTRQWVARKSPTSWSDAQRKEFVEEARPVVEAWVEAGGKL